MPARALATAGLVLATVLAVFASDVATAAAPVRSADCAGSTTARATLAQPSITSTAPPLDCVDSRAPSAELPSAEAAAHESDAAPTVAAGSAATGSAAAGSTATGSTATETVVPGTAGPESAAVEPAVPGTAAVVTTAAATTAPETAAPATAAPRTAAPRTAAAETAAAAPPGPQTLPTGGVQVCDRFGSTPVAGGRYEVQNDVWGSDKPQCVRAFDTGFAVQDAQFTNTDGPASYPSIFTGCHYGTCTAGTSLPRQVSALPTVTSSWSFTGARADQQWDAAYDIWFDPTARRDGTVTGTEMMIWLDATDPKPIGERTGTVDLGGTTWEVWRGVNGAQVISYVATTHTQQVRDLPLSRFFADAVARGVVQPSWYLTSVQAGFEPWTGGAGLATTAFSVTGVTG